LGSPVNAADVESKLAEVRGPEDLKATWGRTAEHLKANHVEGHQEQVGPRLDFNPVSETFVSNAKADSMLTREYRKGYEIPTESAV
jgi:hypothetical protein